MRKRESAEKFHADIVREIRKSKGIRESQTFHSKYTSIEQSEGIEAALKFQKKVIDDFKLRISAKGPPLALEERERGTRVIIGHEREPFQETQMEPKKKWRPERG